MGERQMAITWYIPLPFRPDMIGIFVTMATWTDGPMSKIHMLSINFQLWVISNRPSVSARRQPTLGEPIIFKFGGLMAADGLDFI